MVTAALLFVLGPILGLVLREVGGYAPRWAERLIKRRSMRLPVPDRDEYVSLATERLAQIPGDWSTLIYAWLKLRPDAPGLSARLRMPPPRFLVVPSAAVAVISAIATGQLLELEALPTLVVTLAWGLFVWNLDRFFLLSRRTLHRSLARRLIEAFPRLVLSFLLATVMAQVVALTVFQSAIQDFIDDPDRSGSLIARIDALGALTDSDAVIRGTVLVITILLVLADAVPTLVRIFVGPNAEQPRNKPADEDTGAATS